jgi:hypothetical protein
MSISISQRLFSSALRFERLGKLVCRVFVVCLVP